MIPKKLHLIWVGNRMPEFARYNIEWFRQLNPDFEILVHGEDSLRDEYREYYDMVPEFCSKVDILRLSVLKEHGGWYFDVDFVPLRPISYIEEKYKGMKDFFLTRQTDDPRWEQHKVIANGIIGIAKDSAGWEILDEYMKQAAAGPVRRTMFGPELMTRVVKEHPDKVTVAEKRDFYIWSLGAHGDGIKFFKELVAHGWSWGKIVKKFDRDGRPEKTPIAFHLWAGGGDGDITPREHLWSHKPSPAKKVVLIANNQSKLGNYNRVINSMDVVIRMNECLGYGNEQFRMGQKTTVWGCINAGRGASPKFMSPKPYLIPGGRVGDEIDHVWFSRPKGWQNRNGNDDSAKILSAQQFRPEVDIRWPTKVEWDRLHDELREFQKNFDSPSTGMVLLYMALNTPDWEDYEFYLMGFTHRGWDGHPFSAERGLMAKYIEQGRLHRLEDHTEIPGEETV